jgi:hypothetical protein
MSSKTLLNIALFFLAIILGSVIYFSEEKSHELKRLSEIDINTINSIVIRHNKNNTTIEKHDDGHWRITAPLVIDANDFRINSILKLLNAPVHSDYSLSEIDVTTIGLKEAVTSIQLNSNRIEFGITNPATNLRYIKFNNRVFTIEDVFFPLLSSHFSTLVSFNLLPKNASLEKLILPGLTISRDDQGRWHSDSNISADNISKIIDHWKNDQAFGVHKYLEREQQGEIIIYLAGQQHGQQAVSYTITDTDPWLILSRKDIGLEYHLDIEAYSKLIKP